jgi:hypothetical protein
LLAATHSAVRVFFPVNPEITRRTEAGASADRHSFPQSA